MNTKIYIYIFCINIWIPVDGGETIVNDYLGQTLICATDHECSVSHIYVCTLYTYMY